VAHLQFTQANTKPKIAKEPQKPTHSRQRKRSKLKGKMAEMNQHQPIINSNMSGAQHPASITG